MRIPMSDIRGVRVHIRLDVGTTARPDIRVVSIGPVFYGADIGEILNVADAIMTVLDGRYDGVRMIPTFALYWEDV